MSERISCQGAVRSAGSEIWDSVAGIPSPHRQNAPIFMLQAYLDDSRQSGKLLVLGGYIATSEDWAAFADEWQYMLQVVHPSDEFKMSELASRWGECDEKIMWFYRIIEKYAVREFSVGVPLNEYNYIASHFPLNYKVVTPYIVGLSALFEVLLKNRNTLMLDGPIEFFCDEQMEEKLKVFEAYDHAGKSVALQGKYKNFISSSPRFVDSKKYLPMQAADLYVWWMRKAWLETPGSNTSWPFPWKPTRSSISVNVYMHERNMRNFFWYASRLRSKPKTVDGKGPSTRAWFWPEPIIRYP